jgi:hypothetical protein
VNAEFNWWLLIVGLVIGGGLAWLVLSDTSRREIDIEEREMAAEARWIAETLADSGQAIDDDRVLEILRLHRGYRAAPPPDIGDEMQPGHDARWPLHADAGDRPRMAHPVSPSADRTEQDAITESAQDAPSQPR